LWGFWIIRSFVWGFRHDQADPDIRRRTAAARRSSRAPHGRPRGRCAGRTRRRGARSGAWRLLPVVLLCGVASAGRLASAVSDADRPLTYCSVADPAISETCRPARASFALRLRGAFGLPRPGRRAGTGASRMPRASSAGTKGTGPSGPAGAALNQKRTLNTAVRVHKWSAASSTLDQLRERPTGNKRAPELVLSSSEASSLSGRADRI
jgi:hypothetical protein